MDSPDIVAQQNCLGLKGNPDLYGVGIRVGIYLQWISTLLTNIFVLSGVSDSLDTNSIFLFAIFIAIANATKSAGVEPLLGTIGGFVMLQMCFGYVLCGMSITGLRITLLSNPESIDTKLSNAKVSRHPTPDQTIINDAKKAEIHRLWKLSKEEKPEGLAISKFIMASFRCFDTLAFASFRPDFSMEPIMWFVDLYVTITLQSPTVVPGNPEREYVQSRLRNYKTIRTLARNLLSEEIFSLGVSSVYKHDQFSWLGVCWRLFLTRGIAFYNVWYWFRGVSYLHTNSCDVYIFLFTKVSILGASQIFFKVIAIIYAWYAGMILIVGLGYLLAFYQTLIKSWMINSIIFPYAMAILFLSSLGSSNARATLDELSNTQRKLMQWLELPTLRQTLCGYACLCSNLEESSSKTGGQPRPQGSNTAISTL